MSAFGFVCEPEVGDEETLIFWTLLGVVLCVFFEDSLRRLLGGELRPTPFSPDSDISFLLEVELPKLMKNEIIN